MREGYADTSDPEPKRVWFWQARRFLKEHGGMVWSTNWYDRIRPWYVPCRIGP